MKGFVSDPDFLLGTETGSALYHGWAEKQPIIDYHCHIDPREIWEDRRFEDIAQVWLGGDHYKWRLMRANGVDEAYITGDAPDREKFQKWAETLELAIGNPLYHWSHLELRRYFGYEGVLNGDTAQEVWELCNDKLQNDPAMSARGLILGSNVAMVGTTDDPTVSRITIEVMADEAMTEQIMNQLRKQFPVYSVQELKPERSIRRELVMFKVRAETPDIRNEVIQIANIFRASIIDVSLKSLTLALIGDESKADAMQKLLEAFGILELVRTGMVALERGAYTIGDETKEQTEFNLGKNFL